MSIFDRLIDISSQMYKKGEKKDRERERERERERKKHECSRIDDAIKFASEKQEFHGYQLLGGEKDIHRETCKINFTRVSGGVIVYFIRNFIGRPSVVLKMRSLPSVPCHSFNLTRYTCPRNGQEKTILNALIFAMTVFSRMEFGIKIWSRYKRIIRIVTEIFYNVRSMM